MMLRTPGYRTRLFLVVLTVVVLLISALAIADHVALSGLNRAFTSSSHRLETLSLNTKLAALEDRLDTLERQPPAVIADQYSKEHRLLQERLSHLEEITKEAIVASDVVPLSNRVTVIETRLAHSKQSSAPLPLPLTKPTTDEPKTIEPPFSLLGIELRGGEQFVSLAPVGVDSLARVHLLRVGDFEGEWQLEAIETNAAQFRVGGRSQRLVIK